MEEEDEDEEPPVKLTAKEIEDLVSPDTAAQELIKDLCKDTADYHNDSYTPFTRDWDSIKEHPVATDFHASWSKSIEDEVSHMIGPLSKNLERAFRAANKSRWEGGKKSGRINGASLSRLLANDPRVMRTREVMQTKEVAVSLLVDFSGSMSGSKLNIAIKAAWALGEVLTKLNINCEILGFTTQNVAPEYSYLMDECRKSKKLYARRTPIYIPIFKSFGERFGTQQKARIASAKERDDFLSQNIDGESLLYAASRLRKQPEPGKILIVLSDGEPAGSGGWGDLDAHLKGVVKTLTAEGINTRVLPEACCA